MMHKNELRIDTSHQLKYFHSTNIVYQFTRVDSIQDVVAKAITSLAVVRTFLRGDGFREFQIANNLYQRIVSGSVFRWIKKWIVSELMAVLKPKSYSLNPLDVFRILVFLCSDGYRVYRSRLRLLQTRDAQRSYCGALSFCSCCTQGYMESGQAWLTSISEYGWS